MGTLLGVNVPYLRGEYGHDLAENPRFPTWPCRFDPMEAYRPLIEAKRLGFGAVRIWLCENAEGLRVEEGRVAGVSERLLESVRVIQEGAALHGLYVYWTILDGNAVAREGDDVTRRILSEPDEAARFAERCVGPLARAMDPRVTFAIELVNEPETTTAACDAPSPITWEQLGASLRILGAAARAERAVPITSGTTHVFLPQLWGADPGLDAIDLHMYHSGGGLPSREDLVAYMGDAARERPLIGGEVGIPKDPGPDEPAALRNYIHNARSLDYAAAFLWQLSGELIDRERDGQATWLGEQVAQLLRSS